MYMVYGKINFFLSLSFFKMVFKIEPIERILKLNNDFYSRDSYSSFDENKDNKSFKDIFNEEKDKDLNELKSKIFSYKNDYYRL